MLTSVLFSRENSTAYKALKVCSYLVLWSFLYHKVNCLLNIIYICFMSLSQTAHELACSIRIARCTSPFCYNSSKKFLLLACNVHCMHTYVLLRLLCKARLFCCSSSRCKRYVR